MTALRRCARAFALRARHVPTPPHAPPPTPGARARCLHASARTGSAASSADGGTPPRSSSSSSSGGGVGVVAALAAAAGFAAYASLDDEQSSRAQFAFFGAVSPLARLVDPETAHELGVALLAAGVAPLETRPDPPSLRVSRWGLDFPNPIGLAAGFDKDARAFPALIGMGFGFVEIGSVTPEPQPGNPRPRVFRLPEHAAVINRYGFNSEGHAAARARLEAYREVCPRGGAEDRPTERPVGVLGVNLGKNKTTPEALAAEDYVRGVERLGAAADYIVVNVSSPNTPGLRDLQSKKHLTGLMTKVVAERDELDRKEERRGDDADAKKSARARGKRKNTPVLLKIAPDLSDAEVRNVCDAALRSRVDGIIVSNTTIARPGAIAAHPLGGESGGLSGAPLADASAEVLAKVYARVGDAIPLVGCGGVGSGEDAYRKIRAGASLVQMYTAFAYEGPALVPRMKEELAACLARDGFESVEDAVGADRKQKKSAASFFSR